MNENKKEWNVKELAEKNIFVQNAKAIKFYSKEDNKDFFSLDSKELYLNENTKLTIKKDKDLSEIVTENYLEFLKVARDMTLNKMVEELE